VTKVLGFHKCVKCGRYLVFGAFGISGYVKPTGTFIKRSGKNVPICFECLKAEKLEKDFKKIVKKVEAQREESFKEGYSAALAWTKKASYEGIEKTSKLIDEGILNPRLLPKEYIRGSEEFKEGFRFCLKRILEKSKIKRAPRRASHRKR
jgi:hypothetical protein